MDEHDTVILSTEPSTNMTSTVEVKSPLKRLMSKDDKTSTPTAQIVTMKSNGIYQIQNQNLNSPPAAKRLAISQLKHDSVVDAATAAAADTAQIVTVSNHQGEFIKTEEVFQVVSIASEDMAGAQVLTVTNSPVPANFVQNTPDKQIIEASLVSNYDYRYPYVQTIAQPTIESGQTCAGSFYIQGSTVPNNRIKELKSDVDFTSRIKDTSISPTPIIIQGNTSTKVNTYLDLSSRLKELQQETTPRRQLQSPDDKFEVCVICGDRASGRHYGVVSCEGCKGFFKRSIRKQLGYQCRGQHSCPITKHFRNRCQYCRLQKCLSCGMRSESVQQERRPCEFIKSERMSLSPANQRIFIRKDFGNLNTTMPNFPIASLDTSTSSPQQKPMLNNIQDRLVKTTDGDFIITNANDNSDNDLSTLANVVTSMATLNKIKDVPLKQQINPSEIILDNPEIESGSQNAFSILAKLVEPNNPICIHENETLALNDSYIAAETDNNVQPMLLDIDGPLLAEHNFTFVMTTPVLMPSYLTVHHICETAARLLFLSIHWTRQVSTFPILSSRIQNQLVRLNWGSLFVLGLTQTAQSIHLMTILTAISKHLSTSIKKDVSLTKVTDTIKILQEFSAMMTGFEVDPVEYGYLRSLILFNTDHGKLTVSKRQVEKFQEKAMHELQDYAISSYPSQTDRLSKLLLRLPTLRLFQHSVLEQIFFAGLIGNVQIDMVVPYILSMDATLDGSGGGELTVPDKMVMIDATSASGGTAIINQS